MNVRWFTTVEDFRERMRSISAPGAPDVCAELSPDGERICILDIGHSEPHPWGTTPHCPICKHEWGRHDPEDGRCDAHSNEPGVFGPCRCGRSLTFWTVHNAELSRAALADRSGVVDPELAAMTRRITEEG